MPLIPGIPQLSIGITLPQITIASTQAASDMLWQAAQVPPAWGVFDQNGDQVLFPDSVLEFSNRKEYDIPTFPVVEGSFASYNKVIRPFEIQLRFSKGGTEDERAQFLSDLDDLASSLDLFDVVTPERVYQDVNLVRYEVIRRGAKGAYFLTEVDAYFEQVIEVQAQYTTTAVQLPNASNESALPTSNVGTVQPQPANSQELQDGNAALASQPAEFY
jgi:hypothetical protein